MVSYVFPVHNESEILESRIKQFINGLNQDKSSYEIILVENGSKDDSWKIINKLSKKYPNLKPISIKSASYGQAVRKGMSEVKGKYVFILHVDFFDQKFIKQSLKLLKVIDVVIASKTLPKSQDNRDLVRKLTTYFFNVFIRLVLNFPGTDTHGIKAFKNNPALRRALKRCRTKEWLFETEIVLRCHYEGATMVELPIEVSEIRQARRGFFSRGLETFYDLLSALWSKYFLTYQTEDRLVADDYGLSKKINSAILEDLSKSRLWGVSVLPNFIDKKSASQLKNNLNSAKVSAHLNLVEGPPVSSKNDIPSLINPVSGKFYPPSIFLIKLIIRKIKPNEVRFELYNQIVKLRQFGLKPTHLSSHYHLHLLNPMKALASSIASDNKIKLIRSKQSVYRYLVKKPVKLILFKLINVLTGPIYPQQNKGKSGNRSKDHLEFIIHPGTLKDKGFIW